MSRTKENLWGELIMQYLGKECIYCLTKENLQIHHIIPLYVGGKNIMSNVEIVCNKCHYELHRVWLKVSPQKKKTILVECKNCGRELIRKINNHDAPKCENCKYAQKRKRYANNKLR